MIRGSGNGLNPRRLGRLKRTELRERSSGWVEEEMSRLVEVR